MSGQQIRFSGVIRADNMAHAEVIATVLAALGWKGGARMVVAEDDGTRIEKPVEITAWP